MRFKTIVLLGALLLMVSPLLIAQSRGTGAIVGTIADDGGFPLPGVTVTISSAKMLGERTAITNVEGQYRFPALPPGVYQIEAQLQGFGTVIQENVRLTTTVRLTIDLTLQPASISEEVTVIAESPTVDVKSTETASVTLSDDILRNVPYSNFSTDIVNLAPGVMGDAAYGASSGTGVAYQLDGVDVSDPEGGTAWVFNDPNIVEEAKVMGLGASAEYGNFTGVIFNMVTKSGGNEFSGMTQFVYQGTRDDSSFWVGSNASAYLDDFPDLTSPAESLTDFALNLGGPIIKDKIWFFLGAQYYYTKTAVTGFPETVDYKQPRFFAKITTQLTSRTNINSFFEYDAYQGTNRGAGSNVSPEATVTQDSPDIVGNFQLTHILSERTFFDLKGSFFHGYYYLDPEVGIEPNMHYSYNDNRITESAGDFYYADRDRMQANASITHYAEDFIQGDHDFKFGMEFENSKVRNRYGFTGNNNLWYYDLVGYSDYGYYYNGNYLAFQYVGYDTHTKFSRLEEFVQDSWKVSDRLNLSIGVRFTQMWGSVEGVSGSVYSNNRIAPRLGFTFDLLGDKTTILKAHFGQYTEAMLSTYHNRLNPSSAYSDWVEYYWDVFDDQWVEYYRESPEDKYSISDNIKHPYVNQFVFGIERELFRNTSLSATFIYRNWNNFVGVVNTTSQYEQVAYNVPELGETFTLYKLTNPDTNPNYNIQNISKEGWILEEPYRNYNGLELLFNKRFSNNWQLLASYVYGVTKGTMNNSSADDTGGWNDAIADPNNWINAEGHPFYDPTHMLKVQGTYVFPLGISLTGSFRAVTGWSWEDRVYINRLGPGQTRMTFRAEPRGTNHYPMQKLLDIRLEKIFTFASKYRLGLMFDVFNVFNDDTIRSWGTRLGNDWFLNDWPTTDGHELYSLVQARQARLGIRLTF